MSDAEIRVECIKLAVAASGGLDVLQAARDFYAFVKEGGQ
jgi:hypothetical protein